MDALDLVIVAALGLNVLLGYMFGLVRRMVGLLGLFAGVGAATLTSANTSTQVASTLGWQSAILAHAATYLGMMVGTIVLFEVLGSVYQRHITAFVASFFDSVTGMLAGGIVGALEVTILLIIAVGVVNTPLPPGYVYPPAFLTAQQLFFGSALAPHFYALEPLTKTIFVLVLPQDIGAYFTQLLAR